MLAAVAGAAAVATAEEAGQERAGGIATNARIPADFPVTVTDLAGESVMLRDRIPPARKDAQVVLLVFWASWCAPCIQEIPTLRSLNDFYGPKGFAVVGVGMSEGGDTVAHVKSAMNRHGVNYEVLFDARGEARKAFDMPGIPWAALVDREGVVQWAGPALPKDVSALIRGLLAPKEDRGTR